MLRPSYLRRISGTSVAPHAGRTLAPPRMLFRPEAQLRIVEYTPTEKRAPEAQSLETRTVGAAPPLKAPALEAPGGEVQLPHAKDGSYRGGERYVEHEIRTVPVAGSLRDSNDRPLPRRDGMRTEGEPTRPPVLQARAPAPLEVAPSAARDEEPLRPIHSRDNALNIPQSEPQVRTIEHIVHRQLADEQPRRVEPRIERPQEPATPAPRMARNAELRSTTLILPKPRVHSEAPHGFGRPLLMQPKNTEASRSGTVRIGTLEVRIVPPPQPQTLTAQGQPTSVRPPAQREIARAFGTYGLVQG